jgi:hypothetical protein
MEELLEKANIGVYGIQADDITLEAAGFGGNSQEDAAHKEHRSPRAFRSPSGLHIMFNKKPKSEYSLVYEDGDFVLMKNGNLLWENIQFESRPKYYEQKTSDGHPMMEIGGILSDHCFQVWFSNECAFSEKGEACIFCHMVTRPADTFLKTPRQIAESFKAAYDEGVARRVDFTGGVITERREIEYYCDALEAIHDAIGTDDIHSCAAIAAPRDFDNIVKLKEAGYTNIVLNMEIWDENIFKTVCPGKHRTVGRDRWIEAEKFAAEVFGFGAVRCNFVSGIEPKLKTLEGIEYFAPYGVVGHPNTLMPTDGTPLGGTRCPTPEWILDLHIKTAEILRKAGHQIDVARYISPVPFSLFQDYWRIQEGAPLLF